jgi:glycosyltransferase involved in cell wall biosynthesis
VTSGLDVESSLSGEGPSFRPLAALRVGFVSGAPAWAGPVVYTNHALQRFVDELARRAGHLELALPVESERGAGHTHSLPEASNTFSFRPLPQISSFAAGFLQGRACKGVIRQMERHCDVVYVQLPFSPPQALLGAHTPRVYQVCADCVGVVRASPYYRGLKRCAAVGAALAVDRLQRSLMRHPRVRVITNGEELYRHYGRPPGRALVSASLWEGEIDSVVRQRENDGRRRILFVGYLRPEKGIDTLLDAFRIIRDRLPTAELHIIGGQDLQAGGAADELRAQLGGGDLGDSVCLFGGIPFGPELFQTFADADVLLLPSRSEGTPRVLNEARSFGCPVVATAVGGIKTSVEDEVDGLLVPPDDSARLAAATLRIFDEPSLRDRLVEVGKKRMRERTMERFVDQVEQELVNAAEL